MVNTTEFELPENLTIVNIHSIHEMFEAAIDDNVHDQILINAEKVQRADSAGIQLLQALLIAAKERQIHVLWRNPSLKLISVAEVLGMKASLGLA
jgi:anti-anti-sigma regulatory factor